MENKICVITGCNTGIGKATALELARKGFDIVMLVRESEKSKQAFAEIKNASQSGNVKLYFVDLSSLTSIRQTTTKMLDELSKIDVLINNAGVYKRKEEMSVDGFEMTFAVNYLATFSLTNVLMPLLKKSDSARIVNLSSELYKKGKVTLGQLAKASKFNGDQVYANAKLLVIYFTFELAARLKADGITANVVHPGVVGTDVFRDYPGWFAGLLKLFISKPETGAKPSVYLASSEAVAGITGKYFNKTKKVDLPAVENNRELLKAVWDETIEIIKPLVLKPER